MNAFKLSWHMTARGLGWTLPVGAVLGALYSMVIMGLLFLITQAAGGTQGQTPPAFAVVSMEIVLGIGGAIVGGLIGVVFGPIGGLLFSFMTRLYFAPPIDPARYNRSAGIAGTIYGAVATVVGLWVIGGFNVPPPTGQTGNALLFYVLPGLIGAGAGYFISQQIAQWYREATATVESQKAATLRSSPAAS